MSSYRARRSQRLVIALCIGLVLSVAAVGWVIAPMFEAPAGIEPREPSSTAQAERGSGGGAAEARTACDEERDESGSEQGGAQSDGAESEEAPSDSDHDGARPAGPNDTRNGADAAVHGGTTSGGDSGSASGGSGASSAGSGARRTSSGRTWRENPFDAQPTVDGEEQEELDEEQPLPEYWLAQVESLEGEPVAISLGLFEPQPPHELRETGLHGDGRPLATRYVDSDASGRLAVPMQEVLGILGKDVTARTVADLGGAQRHARLRLGVFVDDPRFEPLIMTLSLNQEPTSPPRILLTEAHYVEIRVREEVSDRPLAEAEVELWRFDPNDPQTELDRLTLRTDSQGTIMSRIMPGRSYAFRIRKVGYATSRTERFVSEERDVYYQIPLYRGNFLSGHVVNSAGAPIRDATVTCIQPGHGQDEALTDPFGHFYVDRIPHGVWSSEAFVTVEAEGYATLVEQVLVNSENVELTVSDDAGLTGTVYPSDGSELAATTLTARQELYGDETFEHEFAVEPDGSFAVAGLIEGQVVLEAHSEIGETSDEITLQYDPHTPQEVEIQLNPPARLFVEVERPDGEAIEGLLLQVGDWQGETDAAGSVLWEQLLPGEHTLLVVPDEPQGNRATAGELVYFVPDAVELELSSGETAEVSLTLSLWLPPTETTPLEVRFQGDPVVGTAGTATLLASFGGGQDSTTYPVTFEGGLGIITVELRTDPEVAAVHELNFEHPDYQPVRREQEELAAAAQAEQPMVINLVRAPSLSLQIVDRNGAHVEQAGVQLRRGGEAQASGQTDGVGRILFTHLEQGSYRLVAVKHAYRRAIFDIELPIDASFESLERDDGSALELTEQGQGTSADPTRLKLTMSNAGDVTISVQTLHGAPAVGAQVLVKRRHDPNAPLVIFDVGTIDGQGDRIVRLHWDAEYQIVVYNEEGIAFEHFYNDPEEPIYTFELGMEPRGTISGTVENPDGSAAENVEVRLVQSSGPLAQTDNFFSARTNSNGEWSIPVPVEGTYDATCPDESGTTPVTNLNADTSNVTLIRGQ